MAFGSRQLAEQVRFGTTLADKLAALPHRMPDVRGPVGSVARARPSDGSRARASGSRAAAQTSCPAERRRSCPRAPRARQPRAPGAGALRPRAAPVPRCSGAGSGAGGSRACATSSATSRPTWPGWSPPGHKLERGAALGLLLGRAGRCVGCALLRGGAPSVPRAGEPRLRAGLGARRSETAGDPGHRGRARPGVRGRDPALAGRA